MKMKALVNIKWSPEQWIYYLFCGTLFVLPMGTSPFTILGALALGVWIFTGEFYRKRYRYLNSSWLWPVLAMAALTWLGLIYSPDPYGLGIKFARKTHYWLYALAIACISFNAIRTERIIGLFLAGLFVNAFVGFVQLGGLVPTLYKDRYAGLSGGYNTLAILLILGILITSFYFRCADRWKNSASVRD